MSSAFLSTVKYKRDPLEEWAIIFPGISSAQRYTDRLPRVGDARPGAGYRPSESKFGLTTTTSRIDEPLSGFQFALRVDLLLYYRLCWLRGGYRVFV